MIQVLALCQSKWWMANTKKYQPWHSLWWPIYIINPVDNTKLPYQTLPLMQHHSFFLNLPNKSDFKL